MIDLDLKVASSSSAAPAADPSLVLAKPNNEKSDDDVEKKLEKRYVFSLTNLHIVQASFLFTARRTNR